MRTTRALHLGIIGVIGFGVVTATALMPGAPPLPVTAILSASAANAADDAFKKFWEAKTATDAEKAVGAVVTAGLDFDAAVARFKAGRPYSAGVKRGIVRLSRKVGGQSFFYDLNIPETYDPSKSYQVRVQLHGGVAGRFASEPRGDGSIGALAGAEQIYVIPYAWDKEPWWKESQVDNLRAILDSVRRTYNVDENRVVVSGVSDGATAAYYVAMRDPTPYAAFMSLNGFMMVLNSPDIGAANDLFPNNLLDKPFFVVNGEQDPLYPARMIDPLIDHLMRSGVSIQYLPQDNGEHNTKWWPEVKDAFEAFVREHPRDPLPAKLTWTSGANDRTNRAHWLVIDKVTSDPDADAVPDVNQFGQVRVTDHSRELFRHSRPFGRVDLVREGNVVEATTRAVAEFTLLLSPQAFDFSKPVKVVVNGRTLFDDIAVPSVQTLARWAARDNDRTMLFGAEVHIKVP